VNESSVWLRVWHTLLMNSVGAPPSRLNLAWYCSARLCSPDSSSTPTLFFRPLPAKGPKDKP
jgi:hypothetical protein